MAWFKVDDKLHSSRKLMQIPRRHRLAAIGLWTVAGAWSADQLTDGNIPDFMIDEWGGSQNLVKLLCDVDLWVPTSSGTVFKNWNEYQPTKAEVEQSRDKNTEKLRRWRERNRVTPPDVTELQGGYEPPCNPAPDPTRPDPTPIKRKNTVHPKADAPDLISEFESWWTDCWRKQAKPDALKAFKAARKDTSLAALVAGAQAYKLLNAGNDKSVMKMPAGWLRDRRWEDEQIVNAAKTTTTHQPDECHMHRGYPLPCDRCARESGGNEF